ncbi:hypothetical protein KC19_4G080100 [Ceratodon purpureus]|uniref:BZIP domain-containing protein n=1 Tax=Ceratodon purpureus TaxID=3225 RepID=A0A8T0I905_CERPU|nr:hypothetical protein KC19_4G080100 [Ceratodon purpureus]
MERKIEIPVLREDDDSTMENAEPPVPTLSSSEASEDWEKISEDWVSLFLDPAILDDHSRSLPSDLENYSQFDSTLPETNDHFSSQDLLADSLLLHSTDDQMSRSDMALGSSLNVVEDLFGKEDSSPQVDLIHPKIEPLGQNGSASPASSLTQVSGGSSSGMEVDLWKDKEANHDLSITLKREMNAEVSSGSESPTSPSSVAIVGDASSPNNPLQSSSRLLQCEEGEIEARDVGREVVSSSNSIARVGTPSTVSQSETFSVRHFQSIGNAIKVGLLGRSGDRGTRAAEDRKNCEAESFKLQNQDVPEDQQSDHSDGDRKEEGGDEDDEKRRARLMRNRESAQLSRQRKKVYVDELEGKLRTMAATVAELNATISHLTAENVNLRRQLGYYYPAPGVCPRPGMPMHVMPMGPYPGMVAGRPMYPGGQMPPVPIPRIKTQTPARSSKRPKSGTTKEGGDKKRTKLKAAGAASMAVMGLLCVAMLFGSIDQGLNSSNGVDDYTSVGNVRVGGRVLTSWNEGVNPLNITGLSSWNSGVGWQPLEPGEYGPEREGVPSVHTRLAAEKLQYENDKSQGIKKAVFESSIRHPIDGNTTLTSSASPDYFNSVKAPLLMGSDGIPTNTSQSFSASVFVPGANGLVKVDGNLIIQAVMAGDEAAKKHFQKKRKSEKAKKKWEMKQRAGASSVLHSRTLILKPVNNLPFRESKVLKNATTGPFVTARPLSGNVNSVVGTNNPVSPVLRAGSLQQWMLGGLHEPIMRERNISDNVKEAMPLPIRNDGRFETLMPFWAALQPLVYNQVLHKKAHKTDTCSVPTLSKLFWAAATVASSEPAKAESRQCLAADRPVLNTGMCTELFQFDTAANTSPGQSSSSEAKNMAESVAAKAAQGSPHNVTSTLSVPVVPRSRRDPFAVPLPPVKPKPSADKPEEGRNGTDPRVEKTVREQMHSQNMRHGVSSMVVSVMAGPEEYGDSRRKGAKGLSRIFVVVLVDNQKYVTYSCMLPSGGPQAHVVAE